MWEIGVMLNNLEPDRLKAFQAARDHGFRVVHTNTLREAWLTGPERVAYVAAARASGLRIDTMFVGYDGQDYRDLPTIARTVGLAIPELRAHRLQVTLAYSDLARDVGAPSLGTHLGFLPEDETSASYRGLVETVRTVADRCAASHQTLHLETGQESADTLLRFVRALDRANVGINFDPANFLLYGTDDPSSALQKLGPLVRGVHCKDGIPPLQPGVLGEEVPLGAGRVHVPALLAQLAVLGYTGALVIEREGGPTAVADILAARDYLRRLRGGVEAIGGAG